MKVKFLSSMLTINYRPYINFFLPSIAYSIYILNPMSTLYQIGEVLINNSIRVLWVNNRNFYFTHLSVIYLSVLELLFILMGLEYPRWNWLHY